jgi:hypothetical protein
VRLAVIEDRDVGPLGATAPADRVHRDGIVPFHVLDRDAVFVGQCQRHSLPYRLVALELDPLAGDEVDVLVVGQGIGLTVRLNDLLVLVGLPGVQADLFHDCVTRLMLVMLT